MDIEAVKRRELEILQGVGTCGVCGEIGCEGTHEAARAAYSRGLHTTIRDLVAEVEQLKEELDQASVALDRARPFLQGIAILKRERDEARAELAGSEEAEKWLESQPGWGPRQPYYGKGLVMALLQFAKEEKRERDEARAALDEAGNRLIEIEKLNRDSVAMAALISAALAWCKWRKQPEWGERITGEGE